MKDPLIIRDGLMQGAGQTRLRLPRVNVGNIETINVAGSTVTIYQTLHHLKSVNNQDVYFLNGGMDGDILILTGQNVRLTGGGNINISGKLRLTSDSAVLLILIESMWVRVVTAI